jgi:hypothetical protein
MAGACSICSHAARHQIDERLVAQAGGKQNKIARDFQVSQSALSRHWRRCGLKEVAESVATERISHHALDVTNEATKLVADLRLLADRCKEAGHGPQFLQVSRELVSAIGTLGKLQGVGSSGNVGIFIGGGGGDLMQALDDIPMERFDVGLLPTSFVGTEAQVRAAKFAAMLRPFQSDRPTPESTIERASALLVREGWTLTPPIKAIAAPGPSEEAQEVAQRYDLAQRTAAYHSKGIPAEPAPTTDPMLGGLDLENRLVIQGRDDDAEKAAQRAADEAEERIRRQNAESLEEPDQDGDGVRFEVE